MTERIYLLVIPFFFCNCHLAGDKHGYPDQRIRWSDDRDLEIAQSRQSIGTLPTIRFLGSFLQSKNFASFPFSLSLFPCNKKLDWDRRIFGLLPRVNFHGLHENQQATNEHDREAFRYLSWALYPLMICYAV